MVSVVAGYLSGVAILASFFPYIRDIFRGTTKPERISWLIWAILVAFWGQAPLAPLLFGAVFVAGAWMLAVVGIFDLPRLWRNPLART